MPKALISLCIFITMSIVSTFTLGQQKSSLLLSNHTFSSEKNMIGTLQLNPGAAATFKLSGENERLFKIKNNTLSIRTKYIRPDVKWYDLNIEVQTPAGNVSETFRLVNDQFIRNRVIAHRGAWKNTASSENSIASLQHAIRLGCQGSEFDVHLSADSVLVVNHDSMIRKC